MNDKRKLDRSEIRVVESFISLYNQIYQKILVLEENLKVIEEKREDLTESLNNLNDDLTDLRKKEHDFTQSLTTKYGEFKLDLETFEIETS